MALNYGGSLAFPAATDAAISHTILAFSIPLYVRSYNVPTRKPKFTDFVTSRQIDRGGFDISAQYVFEAQPEPLSTTLSGFIITPTALHSGKRLWNPTTTGLPTGTGLGLLNVCYPELILAYIEGAASVSATGYGTRVNPSSFTDPYGTVYSFVRIASFEAEYTSTYKRQTFTMTLVLEP